MPLDHQVSGHCAWAAQRLTVVGDRRGVAIEFELIEEDGYVGAFVIRPCLGPAWKLGFAISGGWSGSDLRLVIFGLRLWLLPDLQSQTVAHLLIVFVICR